ncbi:bifunctional non-homologous end joining protein LigD [Actinoplanes campanulatus]|uniref:Bifunctional non-homologous end joining protein LigD n=1 Tax=Actinoplanes campanulatus TaxID=113559 RepID=A0A7W5AM56_9ACTN|nr:DNA polymerase ligase N-terminal domain-containing protein [Actinoplanes campanulatus]MBB3098822.1 bifunctional non-homologous end joining protein LigD [Actinoplanes campanulatus]GGN36868.1 ATP-dependent DNA ligase [Actinoplanes campanulatus]GID42653.1 ATP-dependent DNA ligase [Actinoplanes campanulatus]
MTDRLDEYRRKRDARRTPEPVPRSRPEPSGWRRFVIQQHHARSLHWDVRLERDGVLVSFAVPRGLPRDRARNNLARHTEDHPLEYLDFAGEIPAGQYGGGRMTIFDRGTYEADKWRDDEIGVTFHGERTSGRYVFFRTGDRDWMVRRMDPAEPGWEPMPEALRPMLTTPAAGLPSDDPDWGYEMAWGGRRVLAYVSGGRVRLTEAGGDDVTSWFPEIRPLGPALAPVEAVLDGEIVTFDGARPDPALLARREAPKDSAAARRAAERTPAHLLLYDLLWLEGHATIEVVRYAERRELLEGLSLAGDHWQTPPYFPGGGEFAREAARDQGLPGVVAKRLDSPYLPGRRSRLWRHISA